MTELYNRSTEKEKRRSLRNNMPPAEMIVWSKIRGRQIEGCKFRRQYSIGIFVVDFYAPELKLALEIDGESHFLEGVQEYDLERSAFLVEKGTHILRFTNREVYEELEHVLEAIVLKVQELRKLAETEQFNSYLPPLQGGTEGGDFPKEGTKLC